MKTNNPEEEIRDFLEKWNRSIIEKDVITAAQLRDSGYSATLPDGSVLTKEEEIVLISSPEVIVQSIRTQTVELQAQRNTAMVTSVETIEGRYMEEEIKRQYKSTIALVYKNARWRATSSQTVDEPVGRQPVDLGPVEPPRPARQPAQGSSNSTFNWINLIPRRIKLWAKARIKSVASESAPSFQELAFMPYKPGIDFVIPAKPTAEEVATSELPIPPKELWLGYNYLQHGKANVSKMLEIVYASDFTLKNNARILDLGCGAGRMIRHLQELAKTCEIWGTDISAEHIYWCKQNLSPPFNFATTTKIPHLPFEDRSFDLIYCGSVFTHIDDLADAWLLELHRILAPDGRLYLTIHDNHTIELIEGSHGSSGIAKWIKSHEIYQKSKSSFSMLTIGRDDKSQVFYDVDYFAKTVRQMFDIVSVTQEAYFHQTAFLLKRKSEEAAAN